MSFFELEFENVLLREPSVLVRLWLVAFWFVLVLLDERGRRSNELLELDVELPLWVVAVSP